MLFLCAASFNFIFTMQKSTLNFIFLIFQQHLEEGQVWNDKQLFMMISIIMRTTMVIFLVLKSKIQGIEILLFFFYNIYLIVICVTRPETVILRERVYFDSSANMSTCVIVSGRVIFLFFRFCYKFD